MVPHVYSSHHIKQTGRLWKISTFLPLLALRQLVPKAPSPSLTPKGLDPSTQQLRWSTCLLLFLALPPFPFITLLSPGFLASLSYIHTVLFSLFFSSLSIHFSLSDHLAPSSVPSPSLFVSIPVLHYRAPGRFSQFSPLSSITAHLCKTQNKSPGEEDLQPCQLV